MTDARKDFLKVFLREWEMHGVRQAPEDKGVCFWNNRSAIKVPPFDTEPKAGEIRLFADTDSPMAGLLLADQGKDGWLIIPVSDFTVPATEREILIGKQVLQLWNAFSASTEFTLRSWIVDTLQETDVKDVAEALLDTLEGKPLREDLALLTGLPIVAAGDPRLAYEEEFAAPEQPRETQSRKNSSKRRTYWRRYIYGLAACLMVAFVISRAAFLESKNPTANKHAIAIYDVEPQCAESILSDFEEEPDGQICISDDTANISAVPKCEAPLPAAPRMLGKAKRREPEGTPAIGFSAAYDGDMTMKRKTMTGEKAVVEAPASERYNQESFLDYDENEFVITKVQPLSTFGLDVDTASYTTLRRYLMDMKHLPPRDSVRIEEYVNYFRYNYPQPNGDTPIAVDCELAECPWNKGHKLLRVGLRTREIAKEKLPPSNLVFLLDCSGSMGYNGGFDIARQSMRLLVDQLSPEDSVSIVTYASGTEVKLESTKGTDKSRILDVIESLRSGGSTSGGAGIELAYEQAKKHFELGSNNRVIIVTDGDFNVGVQSPQELVRLIEKKRNSGIFLSVLGVGEGNYRDEMMKKLSGAGNGNYAYIDSLIEAKKILMTEFGASMHTVAKDVKMQIEFNPAQTAAYRLLGYESRHLEAKDFNDDKKDSGEMGAGHNMTAFYELIPVGASDATSNVDPLKYQKTSTIESEELLTLKLRYKEPDGGTSKLVETSVVADRITRKEEPSQDFRFASAVAEFALILKDSKFKANADIKSVIERAKGAKGEDVEGYRAEFIRLAELADLLFSATK